MNYAQLAQALQDYLETAETSFVSNIPTFVRQAEERLARTVMLPELRKNATTTLEAGNSYLQRPTDFLSVFSLAVVDAQGNYSYLYDKDVNFMREAYPSPSQQGLPKYYAQFDGDGFVSAQGNFILAPTPSSNFTVELHYYYDPPSIIPNSITGLGSFVAGFGYTDGNYYGVPLLGGSGTGATANLTISGGAVTSVTVASPGALYTLGDVLTVSTSLIGAGSFFTATVTETANPSGTSWFGDNAETALLYGCLIEAYTYLKGDPDMMQTYMNRYASALVDLFGVDIRSKRDDYRDGTYNKGANQ